MKRTVKNLLNIAVGQIGYKEKASNSNLDVNTANAGGNNYTKYARDLNKAGYYNGNKNGYAWCDVFVDWCFYTLCGKDAKAAQAMTFQTGPYGAGCEFSAGYYKNKGRLHTSDPKPGDQIFFNNYAHTGIIESVSDTKIITIEGNTSNMVARRTYNRNDPAITSFGRPDFEEDDGNEVEVEETTTKTESTTVNTSNTATHTVKKGESWWSIAEDELGNGMKMNELAEFNGKTINVVLHPGDVLKIPGKTTTTSSNTDDNTTTVNTSQPTYTTYTVKKNDSWWSIAAAKMGNGNKMNELATFNGKTINTIIHPGDVLKIPTSNDKMNYILYTVKKNDSWWSIAAAKMGAGGKMSELAKFNGKTTATVIHPGDVLKIPV